MTSQPTTPPSDTPSAEAMARLFDRANMINSIHEALRSTLDLEALCEAAVGALVSAEGMGFSRALIFALDDREQRFRLCAALGADGPEIHRRIRAAEAAEETSRESEQKTEASDPYDEESLFAHDAFERDRKFWAEVTKKFDGQNALRRSAGDVGIEAPDLATEYESSDVSFVGRLFWRNRSRLAERPRLEDADLPAALKALMAEQTLWGGIRTKNGPRLIVVVDKMYEDAPIDRLDRLHMDWFCSQLALALENAELVEDLRATNEGLQELDRLKGNFLATISHELRTPLTAITGFVRLMLNDRVGPMSAGQKQILDRVIVHAERLVNVVNDLIEIVEIDSGRLLHTEIRPVDALEVLMETLPHLEPRRESKSVEIEPVVMGSAPSILADEKALGRIFYHLTDNAIKFSEEGGMVKIVFEPHEDHLAIHVIDKGIGIAPDRVKEIFEMFYQVDSDLARVYEGMGIGLTLTNKLVSGTGGKLKVESEVGKGCTFSVEYPLA